MGQILPTANLHRDYSILNALVYEKEFPHIGKNSGYPDLLCKNMLQGLFSKHALIVSVPVKHGQDKSILGPGVPIRLVQRNLKNK